MDRMWKWREAGGWRELVTAVRLPHDAPLLLAAHHQQQLLDEAARDRLAREARRTDR